MYVGNVYVGNVYNEHYQKYLFTLFYFYLRCSTSDDDERVIFTFDDDTHNN